MNLKSVAFFLLVFSLSNFARATQPAYCDAATFQKALVKYDVKGLERLSLHKLGRVHLAGLAVGESDIASIQNMAQNFSHVGQAEGYCTWYFNEGNDQAERLFEHAYVQNPKDLDQEDGPEHYRQVLEKFFDVRARTFVDCAENFNFIAMGCNGMKHRGPTVFGMLLAFSGCAPEQAAKIVNSVWGLNGVKADVRLAIIREGQRLAEKYPESRERLRAVFEAQ